ncbi:MAG: hypothetical protein ACC726_07340 [Chloroflexota bacterium]
MSTTGASVPSTRQTSASESNRVYPPQPLPAESFAARGDGRQIIDRRTAIRAGIETNEITLFEGRKECGWEGATFMIMGWPPGEPIDRAGLHTYVRDPRGSVLAGRRFRRNVRLPGDAISSGITNGYATIWTGKRLGRDAILLRVGQRFELWPRTEAGCA